MAEYSKYDILIKDLNIVETQVSILNNKYNDELQKNQDLDKVVKEVKAENAFLVEKLSKLESELQNLQSGNNQIGRAHV